MGSGGSFCHDCRKLKCVCPPEPIRYHKPVCPHCGKKFKGSDDHYETFNCDCGRAFNAERKLEYISRPFIAKGKK